jgi:hypothetical protein
MRRLTLLLLLASCGPVDVVLFNLPDGGPPPRGSPCADSNQCPPGAFCDKPGCGAALGHCQPRPPVCDPVPGTVCGCDGVTYFNDCFRAAAGINGMTPGPCAVPLGCTGPGSCPAGSFCALTAEQPTCPAAPSGACWMVPPACPALGGWAPCAGGLCEDFCAAVRSERPHARLACP